MITDRHYPSGYFDPYGDDPTRAQCETCGMWKDVTDMDTVDEVPCLEYGVILQGVCLECAECKEKL